MDPADEEFRRAIELDPAYSTAHQWYGNYLTAMGRFPEAMRTCARPRSAIRSHSSRTPRSAGASTTPATISRRSKQFQRTLELNPDFELAHLWQGQALTAEGELDAATREIGEAVRLSKGTSLTRAALAHVLAAPAGAIRHARYRGAGEGRRRYVPSFEIAKAFLALADRPKAMEWLERAYEERAHSMAFLAVDPQLDDLKKDPAVRGASEESVGDRTAPAVVHVEPARPCPNPSAVQYAGDGGFVGPS